MSVAVSEKNIFVGTYRSGVFRLNDNTANWEAVNNGLTDSIVNSLAIIGTNVFAATDSGIFRSSDNGENWTNVSNGLKNDTVFIPSH